MNKFCPVMWKATLSVWWRLALVLLACGLTASMALRTRYGVHPDERFNVDAFEYFERHAWPPSVGSDAVIYTPYGQSRVYRGELVYWLYGKLGAVVRFALRPEDPEAWLRVSYWSYRLLNVALFGVTLSALLFSRQPRLGPTAIAFTLLCIPQVYYLYAYANSDAWGLSVGIFLFLAALRLTSKPPTAWTWGDAGLLGLYTGLVLAAKLPFLLAIALPYMLLTWHVVGAWRQRTLPSIGQLARWALLVGLLVVALSAPLRVIYPLTQGDFRAAQEQMREERAHDGFKPSNPSAGTLRLATKGVTYCDLLTEYRWLQTTLQSFYGVFGYFTVWLSDEVYLVAAGGALLLLLLTLLGIGLTWRRLPIAVRVSLIVAPFLVALNIGASLYHSLHVDCQPQGRYLFPTLPALAFWFWGTWPVEPRAFRALRLTLFIAALGLAVYALVGVVLPSPILNWG